MKKICDDYIKNNSNINLGDWIYIRIVWSCCNAVKTNNVSYIPLKNLTANFLLEAKTLIEYNSYNLEENEDEGGNWYWVYQENSCSWNDQNAIDFRWFGVQDENEEDITLVYLLKITKASWWGNFSKKVTRWLRYRT